MHKVLGGLGEKGFELQELQHVVIISQKKKRIKVLRYFLVFGIDGFLIISLSLLM